MDGNANDRLNTPRNWFLIKQYQMKMYNACNDKPMDERSNFKTM